MFEQTVALTNAGYFYIFAFVHGEVEEHSQHIRSRRKGKRSCCSFLQLCMRLLCSPPLSPWKLTNLPKCLPCFCHLPIEHDLQLWSQFMFLECQCEQSSQHWIPWPVLIKTLSTAGFLVENTSDSATIHACKSAGSLLLLLLFFFSCFITDLN